MSQQWLLRAKCLELRESSRFHGGPKAESESPEVHVARNNVILAFIKVIDVKLALLPEAAIVPCAVITVPEVAAGEQT